MQKILALVGSELDNYPTSQKYNVTSNTIQTEISKQKNGHKVCDYWMRILTQRAVRKCPNCSLSAVGYNNKATQLCTIFLPTLFFHWFYFQQIERFLTDNNLRHVQNRNEVQPGSFHFHSLALSRGISNYCPLFSIHKLHFSSPANPNYKFRIPALIRTNSA